MKIQLAPLEGITTYIYRNAYNDVYGGIDEFFTPFISPHKNKTLNSKEVNEILPEHNKGLELIPQVLTSNSEDYLKTEKEIKEYGYDNINLNFGCPSATVTTKKKGSGILKDLYYLETFLDEIFEKTCINISIKTRIGFDSSSEWEDILKIYSKFPIKQLIIHPRVRNDFYKNEPDMDAFEYACNNYDGNISYNGNIFSKEKLFEVEKRYEKITAIMIGRGIIANPNLLFESEINEEIEIKKLKEFLNIIYKEYQNTQSGDKNVLFRMKEIWFYLSKNFNLPPKLEKEILKANNCGEYDIAVRKVFSEAPINKNKNNIVF